MRQKLILLIHLLDCHLGDWGQGWGLPLAFRGAKGCITCARARRRGRSRERGRGQAGRGWGRDHLRGDCCGGRGWLPRPVGSLLQVLPLLHCQLSAESKEVLITDKAKGLLAVGVLKSENKGGDRPRKVCGGGTHPRGKLCDLKELVGGVVGD